MLPFCLLSPCALLTRQVDSCLTELVQAATGLQHPAAGLQHTAARSSHYTN